MNELPPTVQELITGYKTFQRYEARDAMYKTASFLVEHFWGQPKEMADGLGVLLLTWNQAFYRYGRLDFLDLEICIAHNQSMLNSFRNRNILSYMPADDSDIVNLYDQFLKALQIAAGKMKGRQSPVATAKALHLLAPAFFPLWDDKIAKAYDCHYDYISFMQKMKKFVEILGVEVESPSEEKTLLKLIDEYNYAKFTKAWV